MDTRPTNAQRLGKLLAMPVSDGARVSDDLGVRLMAKAKDKPEPVDGAHVNRVAKVKPKASRYPIFRVPAVDVAAIFNKAFAERWRNTIAAFCDAAGVSDTSLKAFREGKMDSLTPTVRAAFEGIGLDPEAAAFEGKVADLQRPAGDATDALYRLLKSEHPEEVHAVLSSIQSVRRRHTGSP